MAVLLHGISDWYVNLMNSGDPRVKNWTFMQGPMPTILICLSYVTFVKVIGPQFMKSRPPMNVRGLMILYNFTMVFISTFVFLMLGIKGWFGNYNWRCEPVDYSDSPEAGSIVNLAWWFYLTKFLEFTDTIFFVLRKKFNQITTLHVIHHGIMPMSVWCGVKFTPGGHSTFFAFVNSLVHMVMYFYYGLSAIGPQMNKFLWWKKYITTFQMMQFVVIFIHSFQLLFRECDYPRGFMWWIGAHAILFYFLFSDFYKTTYGNKRSLAKENKNGVSNGCSKPITNGYTNGYGNTNGAHSNGIANGDHSEKAVDNCHTNGGYVANGHSNGVLVHRTKTNDEKAD